MEKAVGFGWAQTWADSENKIKEKKNTMKKTRSLLNKKRACDSDSWPGLKLKDSNT